MQVQQQQPPASFFPGWKQAVARLIEWLAVPLTWSIPKHDGTNPRRILIMEPFLLGDTALIAVMVDPIRTQFPDAEIHLLISEAWIDLYRHDPRIKAVHGWVFPWTKRSGKYQNLIAYVKSWRFVRELRKQSFDVGIDVRGDVRSQVALALLGCKRRLGYTNYLCANVRIKPEAQVRIRGSLLTDSLGEVPLQHATEVNLALVGLLRKTDGVAAILPALRAPSPVKRSSFHIIIHIGAGWTYRCWPTSRWAQLLSRILDQPGVQVTLAGSASEATELRSLCEQTGNRATRVTTSILEMVNLFAGADLMICHDSGPMHVATMLGTPVIALFGPGSVPLYRPISAGSICIEHQSVFPCAPCDQRICIRPDDFCMLAITVDEVWKEVEEKIMKSEK